jgi:4-amino-4-deoxy-L-arabinose transferase-like glycosyltransferase
VPRWRSDLGRIPLEVALPAALVLGYFLVATLDVIVFPYHEWDALSYGEWARLIGEHWQFHFPHIAAQTYQRPFLFVLEGVAWHLFGFSERLGRFIDLFFGIGLVVAVFALTRRLFSRDVAALAAVLLLLVPGFQRGVASGLTDIPVAAMTAFTALAISLETPIFIGLSAGCATLTKSSALPALFGLAVACLIGGRSGLRERVRRLVLPLVVGVAAALLYDELQARRLLTA